MLLAEEREDTTRRRNDCIGLEMGSQSSSTLSCMAIGKCWIWGNASQDASAHLRNKVCPGTSGEEGRR